MVLVNSAFLFYSVFFTGGYMDSLLAPITTYVSVSNLLVPRIVLFVVIGIYLSSAWIFSHAMSFMLATIFTYQYKVVSASFEKVLAESDEGRVSDADVEILRQKHQKISMSVDRADDFLMFHNVGAFCCQLFGGILLLYDMIFYRAENDPVIIFMRVFWMIGVMSGLSLTAAGGIMVNHYVSTK